MQPIHMYIKQSIVMDKKSFLKLLQSVDAFFPVGAFTLSNGLEDYVLCEIIKKEQDLCNYLDSFLQVFAYNDLGLLSLAYRNAQNKKQLLLLDQLAGAMKSAKEIRTGSIRMCSRYIKAREAMGDQIKSLVWYKKQIQGKSALGFYPIALGIYAAELKFSLQDFLLMYGYSVISAIVNNVVKLVPLSQLSGQRVLFGKFDELKNAAEKAIDVDFEMLGTSGCAFEIHCMNHEYLYSRQYMS